MELQPKQVFFFICFVLTTYLFIFVGLLWHLHEMGQHEILSSKQHLTSGAIK